MAGRGPQSFKKRQKEQQRKERQAEKMAKRLQRKQDKLAGGGEEPLDGEVVDADSEESTQELPALEP